MVESLSRKSTPNSYILDPRAALCSLWPSFLSSAYICLAITNCRVVFVVCTMCVYVYVCRRASGVSTVLRKEHMTIGCEIVLRPEGHTHMISAIFSAVLTRIHLPIHLSNPGYIKMPGDI